MQNFIASPELNKLAMHEDGDSIREQERPSKIMGHHRDRDAGFGDGVMQVEGEASLSFGVEIIEGFVE